MGKVYFGAALYRICKMIFHFSDLSELASQRIKHLSPRKRAFCFWRQEKRRKLDYVSTAIPATTFACEIVFNEAQ